jgi:hypothetical protein
MAVGDNNPIRYSLETTLHQATLHKFTAQSLLRVAQHAKIKA